MNILRAAFAIANKDLRSEAKTKQVLPTMLIFAGLVTVIFSFAFDPTNNAVRAIIPGLIWVIIVFAGILGLNRSFLSEQKNDNMHALIIAPIEATSIFLGKFIANFVMLLIVEIVSIPFLFLLFDFRFLGDIGWFIVVLFLGTFGFVGIGTFLAALASNSRSSEMLLPLLLFPITAPLLLGAVQSTRYILTNPDKFHDAIAWIQLIGAYDVILLGISFLLFEYILEV